MPEPRISFDAFFEIDNIEREVRHRVYCLLDQRAFRERREVVTVEDVRACFEQAWREALKDSEQRSS